MNNKESNKSPSRNRILAAGLIMFLFTGTVYAWSILSVPLSDAFGWTSAQLGLNFTITLACFCLGSLVGSKLRVVLGAKLCVQIGGAACLLAFILCTQLNSNRLILLYFAYGVLFGFGAGFSYNVILYTVLTWFPEKHGVASGILLMGFGVSTLLIGNLANVLMHSHLGWRNTYLLLGISTFVVFLIGSFFMRSAVPAQREEAPTASTVGYTTVQMISTPAFWLFFLISIFATLIGSGVIGHTRSIVIECGVATSFASIVVGLQSVCNGLGRMGIGMLYDRFGKTISLLFLTASYTVACVLMLVAFKLQSPVLAVIGVMLIGVGYGGIPVLTAPIAIEEFGTNHYATNVAILTLSLIPASLSATIVGSLQTATGIYVSAFVMFLGVCVLLYVLVFFFRKAAKTHS